MDFLKELPLVNGKTAPYLMAVDNFFTSIGLIDWCTEKGIALVGTMRTDRVGDAPVKAKKDVEKWPRGKIEVTSRENACIASWKDNGAVIVGSNAYGVEPIQKATRWNRVTKEKVDIDCPHSIKMYNGNMGGTDRQDQNVGKLRINIRSKKWWWPLFTWGLNVTLQNCWLLYRRKTPIRFLDFVRDVAQDLLYKNKSVMHYPRRYLQGRLATDGLRYDMTKPHLVDESEDKKRRRCKVCGIKINYVCTTCNVHLHPAGCFKKYHME